MQKNDSNQQAPVKGIRNWLSNEYLRFGIVAVIYLLWVIWLGNYWFLLGLPVIFDMYVTKKVNWSFWKSRTKKNHWLIEWLDALIFALVAVSVINVFLFQNYKIPTGSMEKSLLIGDHLFVSKLSYGPRIPNTPLAVPFAQHTLPGTVNTKSYVEWIKWPYKRLVGFGQVKRDDIVVFNFPEGDTVAVEMQARSYYSIVREFAEQLQMQAIRNGTKLQPESVYLQQSREMVHQNFTITVRPMDRMDNYIKRCVAIAGDTLRIVNGQIYINSQPQFAYEGIQQRYNVVTDGTPINPRLFEKLGIYRSDVSNYGNSSYEIPLTKSFADQLTKTSNVKSVTPKEHEAGEYASYIFPHSPAYPWNEDNFGPLWIPKKGTTVALTLENLPIYERIIDVYEDNDLQIREGKIFINGAEANSYTFKLDYFFMMGDNRHDSADSRFWGFVPETHLIGKPRFIWLSLNKEAKGFFSSIRWKRMFMGV